MRLLANENIPLSVVILLRQAGHDVLSLSESAPGIKDEVVLDVSQQESRVILTFDRDYGELIYRHGRSFSAGVVYFHFVPAFPDEPAQLFLEYVKAAGKFSNKFTVLDRERMRQRDLPSMPASTS